ncbi:cell adhesion molecule CEACAM5-like [Amphiura filiformis]|uniref:cell adhesion molecule CEACAM5-like n=1 Tax=Amphiura filiformis TaxID=82378 RepID=UPI003B21C429
MASLNVVTVAVCLLLAMTGLSAGQPQITGINPATPTAKLGNNVTVACGVTDLADGQFVSWYTGALVKISENGTVVLTSGRLYEVDVIPGNNGEIIFELKVTNIQQTDNVFECRITNPSNAIIERAFVGVSVVYVPSDQYPTCNPDGNFTATEGELIDLVCESEKAIPTVSITWLDINGQAIDVGNAPNIVGDRITLTYTFSLSRTHNGYEYTCKIRSPVNFPFFLATCISGPINVQYPPDDVRVSLTTHEGYSAFQCEASSNPPPTYSWSFNTAVSNSSYNITDNGQLLVILEPLACDTSNIVATCEASNSVDSFTYDATLCRVPTCTPNNTALETTEDQSLTILCTIDQSVDSLQWQRQNLLTNTNDNLNLLPNTDTLEYQWTVNREHINTLYECVASNTAPPYEGTCQSGPLNEVFFPAENVTIVPATKTIDGAAYEAYWCMADGHPDVITYDWTIEPALDLSLYEVTDLNQNLIIMGNISCETNDIQATCTAMNGIGSSDEATATLCQVPTCSSSPPEFTLIEGDNQTFTCQHNVSPVDINWDKGDTIATGQGVTELTYTYTADRNDSDAFFTCTASSTSQPSYDGICKLGPLYVQFPPEQISIQPRPDNPALYECSAIGEPAFQYVWLIPDLKQDEHYVIKDNGRLLEILDVSGCETDVTAVCMASNDLGSIQQDVKIECGYIAPEPGEKDFIFTPAWIAIIAIGSFMVLVIIIALIICAVQQSPLISVDVRKRSAQDIEQPVQPTRLSMAYDLEMTEDEDSKEKGANNRISTTSSIASSVTSNHMAGIALEEIKEGEEPKDARLVGNDNPSLIGADNPSYSTFGINNPSPRPKKKPDLLNYMTRPDSMDVDVTLGNEPVGESNMTDDTISHETAPDLNILQDDSAREPETPPQTNAPEADSVQEPETAQEPNTPEADSVKEAETVPEINTPEADSAKEPETVPETNTDTTDTDNDPRLSSGTSAMFKQVMEDIDGMLDSDNDADQTPATQEDNKESEVLEM